MVPHCLDGTALLFLVSHLISGALLMRESLPTEYMLRLFSFLSAMERGRARIRAIRKKAF